jgi:hypothetical protein
MNTLDSARENVNSILKNHTTEFPECLDELEKTFEEIGKKHNDSGH